MSHRRLPVIKLPRDAETLLLTARGNLIGAPQPQPGRGIPTQADILGACNDMMLAFTNFVGRNDTAMQSLRQDVAAVQEFAESMGAQLGAFRVGGAGPANDNGGHRDHAAAMQTFGDFLAGGAHEFQGPYAAMQTDKMDDGGFTVPDDVRLEIGRLIRDVSPMRQLAEVINITAGVHKRNVWITPANTGWVGETETRPTTDMSKLTELTFPAHEQYSMPAASSTLLADSRVRMGEEIAEEVRTSFGEQEGIAFCTGTGVKQPRGFLNYPNSNIGDKTRPWGEIEFVKSGDAAGFIASSATAGPVDCLINMVASLKRGYQAGAVWQLNQNSLAIVSKFRDSEGRLIYSQSIQAGVPSTLLGYPVWVNQDMPDVGSNAFPIAFGDFRRGYLVVDRLGISILPDPYTQKPFVLYYTTRRVGGGIQDFKAVKLLKIAA